jgi:hypothetical protein
MDSAPFDPAAGHLIASNGHVHGAVAETIAWFRAEHAKTRLS